VLLLLTIIPSACAQVPSSAVELNQIADGFTAPISLTAPEDGTGRIFVADQIGLIRVLEANGSLLEEPLLDIRELIPKPSTT
jgi:hypothetical protein